MFSSTNRFLHKLLRTNNCKVLHGTRCLIRTKQKTYRAQMEPARATTLTLSPNDTVTDLASMLKFADSLLRLARFCCCWATEPFVTSAWTSNLQHNQYQHYSFACHSQVFDTTLNTARLLGGRIRSDESEFFGFSESVHSVRKSESGFMNLANPVLTRIH